jgi:hypothetical protein
MALSDHSKSNHSNKQCRPRFTAKPIQLNGFELFQQPFINLLPVGKMLHRKINVAMHKCRAYMLAINPIIEVRHAIRRQF